MHRWKSTSSRLQRQAQRCSPCSIRIPPIPTHSNCPALEILILVHCFRLPRDLSQSSYLERACKRLPISNLEFLSITTHDAAESINWAELFKDVQTLARFKLLGAEQVGLHALSHLQIQIRRRGRRNGMTVGALLFHRYW